MLVRDCDSTYPRLSQIGLSGTVSTCTESPMARSCATALTRSAPTTSGMVTAGASTKTVVLASAIRVTPGTGVTGVGTGRLPTRGIPSPRRP